MDAAPPAGVSRRATGAIALTLGLLVLAAPVGAAPGADRGPSGKDRPGTWEMVSVASDGKKGDADSGSSCPYAWDGPTMSDNGRFVAFSSKAGNLDRRDVNESHQSDIFVHDRKSRRTRLVSLTQRGVLPNVSVLPGTCGGLQLNALASKGAGLPRISANGRFVAFADDRPLTDTDDDNVLMDVYVVDLRRGTIELVSVDSRGRSPDGDVPTSPVHKSALDISGDGRYVVFESRSYALDETIAQDEGNAVTEVLNMQGICLPNQKTGACAMQIFVRDRLKDTTKLVSVSPSGEPADSDAMRPSISDDGRYVAFETFAGNMDVADPSPEPCTDITGAQRGAKCLDVFVHDLKTGKTEVVSVDSNEQAGPSTKSFLSSSGTVISDGGRHVIFDGGGDLAPGAGGSLKSGQVYVRDRKTGRTENVAVSSAGELLEAGGSGTISDDGRYAYFVARIPAGAMGCNEETACEGRLRHDLLTGQTDWILRGTNTGFKGSIGASGDIFIELYDGRFQGSLTDDDDDPGTTQDVFIRDLGVSGVGVGGLLTPGARRLRAPQSPNFSRTGVISLKDGSADALLEVPSAEILGGRVVYRPELDDLYVRIDVERLQTLERMPTLLPLPLLYGVELVAGGSRYQIRISGGPTPTFALFGCDEGSCDKLTDLRGGFGTIGDSVVTAVPLMDLGLADGGNIREVEALTSLGTAATGPQRILDQAKVAE